MEEQKHWESIKRFFPPLPSNRQPEKPSFNDDAVLSRNRDFIDKFAPDELSDMLLAYMEYNKGWLHGPLVFYATLRSLQIGGGGQMPMEDFHRPLQSLPLQSLPIASYLWRTCRRDIQCFLPIVLASLSQGERRIVILGYMNLYAGSYKDHRVLDAWLEKYDGKCLLFRPDMPADDLDAWFVSLDRAGFQAILRLGESPLQIIVEQRSDSEPASPAGASSRATTLQEGIDDHASSSYRNPLKNIFDAICYLQAPAQRAPSPENERTYLDDLQELHVYSQERYDGIIESLMSSAQQALQAWVAAAPEELPCLAEAENWAVSFRRVSKNTAVIRTATALVERVAMECGENRGRVMSSRAQSLLGKERLCGAKGVYKHLESLES
jgi:hypothetical protein